MIRIYHFGARPIILILAILTMACGVVGQKRPGTDVSNTPGAFDSYRAYDHFVKGDLYEQSGNLESAADEYRKALIFDPGSIEIRRVLSEVYFQQRKFDEAAILRSEITDKAAEDYNFIADCLRYSQDLESAASFYRRSLEADSTQYMTRLYLAKILQFLGRKQEAEREFERLLELTPEKTEIYLNMAEMYTGFGELNKALESYENAANADSSDMRPLVGLAALHLARGDTALADSLYFVLAQHNWDDADFLNSIISSFFNIRNFERAELLAGRIAELMPESPAALKRYAMLLYGNQKFARAETLMTSIEEAGEADAALYYYLARIKQEKEDLPAAENYFRQSLMRSDTLVDTWINLALVISQQDRYKEAIETMGDAYMTIPAESTTVLFFTAVIHSQNERHELARDGYLRLLSSDPDNIGVRFNLGSAYERMGQFENAEREFSSIIEREPRNALALNYLGYMYADRGINLEKARELIERALAIDPENGAYLDSYAWVLYKMGKYEEALAQMKKALKGEIEDPVLYDHQGDIYLALDQDELARQSWAKALELNPEDEAIRAKMNPK